MLTSLKNSKVHSHLPIMTLFSNELEAENSLQRQVNRHIKRVQMSNSHLQPSLRSGNEPKKYCQLKRYDLHMFEVKISVSCPCKTSPLKYDAKGPTPFLLFWRAIYLYAEKAPGLWRAFIRERLIEMEACSHQYADVPEEWFGRLIEDIRDLVLEILRSD